MNSFIYDIPTKVYFGEHQLSHLGEELAKYGKRVLLTYGGGSIKKSGLYDAVAAEDPEITALRDHPLRLRYVRYVVRLGQIVVQSF